MGRGLLFGVAPWPPKSRSKKAAAVISPHLTPARQPCACRHLIRLCWWFVVHWARVAAHGMAGPVVLADGLKHRRDEEAGRQRAKRSDQS